MNEAITFIKSKRLFSYFFSKYEKLSNRGRGNLLPRLHYCACRRTRCRDGTSCYMSNTYGDDLYGMTRLMSSLQSSCYNSSNGKRENINKWLNSLYDLTGLMSIDCSCSCSKYHVRMICSSSMSLIYSNSSTSYRNSVHLRACKYGITYSSY